MIRQAKRMDGIASAIFSQTVSYTHLDVYKRQGGVYVKEYVTSHLRNIAIVGHGKSGKTTLTEAMLLNTGVVSRMGKPEDGTTVSDFEPEEIKRKLSIGASLIACEWEEHKLNFRCV